LVKFAKKKKKNPKAVNRLITDEDEEGDGMVEKKREKGKSTMGEALPESSEEEDSSEGEEEDKKDHEDHEDHEEHEAKKKALLATLESTFSGEGGTAGIVRGGGFVGEGGR
jgi:hypothetical protein